MRAELCSHYWGFVHTPILDDLAADSRQLGVDLQHRSTDSNADQNNANSYIDDECIVVSSVSV